MKYSGGNVHAAAEALARRMRSAAIAFATLAKDAGIRWSDDSCHRLGASLAYYALFSLFPLALLSLTAVGFFLGEDEGVRSRLVASVSGAASPAARDLFDQTLQSMQSHRTARGVGALLGTVTLLFGASGVFAELQASLDSICRLKKARSTQSVLATLLEALRAKAFSFVIVVAAAVALLVSLVVSTALSAAGNGVAGIFGEGWFLFEETASIAFLTVLLAAIYRMVPHEHMAWGDVLGGALLTSLLFAGLKRLLAFYLVHLASYAAYGVVGGILGLLTWIYIANLMLFYGAEFSRVYAERFGSLRGAGATLPRESRKLTGSCPDL